MDFKLTAAIIFGKIIAALTKLKGGGATAAPGLYALKMETELVSKLSKKISNGALVISGTNGKTTTSRLVFDIIKTKNNPIHNRQGSNLLRGMASELISKSSITGNIKEDIAVWEVDEATVPEAVNKTKPKIVLLLNLFRDQLDRYGEVNTTKAKWEKAVLALPKETTLMLNADDPQIASLAKNAKCKTVFFGIEDTKINLPSITHTQDINYCPLCMGKLAYSAVFSAHMGHYKCSECSFKRPSPQISASNIQFSTHFTTKLSLTINQVPGTINYNLPGLYNVYNILAASSVTASLEFPQAVITQKIKEFSSAFGRFQKTKVGEKEIITFLIKNPTGANEVIRTLALKVNLNVLTILNDNFADGRDVSWIWDTDWETLVPKISSINISGIRAWDLAARLKYAGAKLSKESVSTNINYSIQNAINNLNTKDTLVILPTYTALLEIQKSLSKIGAQTKWHAQ